MSRVLLFRPFSLVSGKMKKQFLFFSSKNKALFNKKENLISVGWTERWAVLILVISWCSEAKLSFSSDERINLIEIETKTTRWSSKSCWRTKKEEASIVIKQEEKPTFQFGTKIFFRRGKKSLREFFRRRFNLIRVRRGHSIENFAFYVCRSIKTRSSTSFFDSFYSRRKEKNV